MACVSSDDLSIIRSLRRSYVRSVNVVQRSARFVGGGGYLPSGEFQLPSLHWPLKIVKISQKYIADPLWFSYKSSTGPAKDKYNSHWLSSGGIL